MHDPMVVVFDVKLPIPRLSHSWAKAPRNAVRRRRYTNPDPKWLNKPIYPLWRPAAYEVYLGGRQVRLVEFCTVWHNEPGGADSGRVCKGMGGSNLNWHNVKWAIRHRRHLSFQVRPVQVVRAWFERCEECHRRMHRSTRFGTGWDAPGVLHYECHELRSLRAALADHHAYVEGRADNNVKWRVEYQREGRLIRAAESVVKEAEV